MEPCEDPMHPGNSPVHQTGKRCIEPGCAGPAGTAWSPYWCQPCNAVRIKRISDNLALMIEHFDRMKEGP